MRSCVLRPLRVSAPRRAQAHSARSSVCVVNASSTKVDNLGQWILRAAAAYFTPAEGTNPPYLMQPYGGTITTSDRQSLKKLSNVLTTVKNTLEMEHADAPEPANSDFGHFVAEAVATVFTKPNVSEEDVFRGTLTGWSADVTPKSKRAKLIQKVGEFKKELSKLGA